MASGDFGREGDMASLSSWCDSPFVDRQVEFFSGSQPSFAFFPNETGINIYVNQVIVSCAMAVATCGLGNQTFGGN